MCAFATGLIFIFTPAYGGFVYYGVTPSDYPPFTYNSLPWAWLPSFEKLRHGYNAIDETIIAALISFPSYHAAASALTVWAAWSFRWLRLPMLLLNVGLFAGALVYGTHHLIDLIAGVAIACGAVVVAKKIVCDVH